MKIGILVGQPLALNFGPDHEGVHGPSDALLAGFLLVGGRLLAADAPAAFDGRVGHHHPRRLGPAHLVLAHGRVVLAQVAASRLVVVMQLVLLPVLLVLLDVIAGPHRIAAELLLHLLLLLRPVAVVRGESGSVRMVVGRRRRRQRWRIEFESGCLHVVEARVVELLDVVGVRDDAGPSESFHLFGLWSRNWKRVGFSVSIKKSNRKKRS